MANLQISMAAARVNAGFTQREIAAKMQVSTATILNWEKGKVVPKPAQLKMFYARSWGSTPGSGRFPGEGNGTPLQCSCLENPTGRAEWRSTVHGAAKSQTRLK